jgi:hypothetical protein
MSRIRQPGRLPDDLPPSLAGQIATAEADGVAGADALLFEGAADSLRALTRDVADAEGAIRPIIRDERPSPHPGISS